MNERVEFNEFPPEPIRLVWCAWLEHHGINPGDVCACGWIERDEDHRQIRYEAYARDEQGRHVLNEARDDAVREVRVVQLEAAPSPFPPEAS